MLDEIIERGELRVGMTLQFEPEMYLDDNGEPAGYDVELLNLLATDLGVELAIENQEFDALIPGLLAGQWDMISVGLVPRPARLLQMYFTDAYVPYEQVLVAAADSDREPTIEAYNVEGTTITALQGSTAAEQVTTQFPNATLAEFPQQDAAFLEVASGRADAIVVESYLAERFIQANPDQLAVVALGAPLQIEFGAVRHPARRRQVPDVPQQLAAVLQEQRHARHPLRRGLRLGSERQHLGRGDVTARASTAGARLSRHRRRLGNRPSRRHQPRRTRRHRRVRRHRRRVGGSDQLRRRHVRVVGAPRRHRRAACDDLVAGVVADHGRLDALVTCAGIEVGGPAEEALRRRLAPRHRRQPQWDVLVRPRRRTGHDRRPATVGASCSSARSTRASPSPVRPPTARPKGGVAMLGAALAVDWARHGITVNTVGPGVVDTPMSAASLADPSAGRC